MVALEAFLAKDQETIPYLIPTSLWELHVQFVKPLASSSFDPSVSDIFCLCLFFFLTCTFLFASQPSASISHITDFPTTFPDGVFQNTSDVPLSDHARTCQRTACMLVCHSRKKKKKASSGKTWHWVSHSVAYSPRLKTNKQTNTHSLTHNNLEVAVSWNPPMSSS